jgi:threonine aldolase
MRAAIAAAKVGDEQRLEDPTVTALEQRAAELLGQEEALLVPTATMANQIALRLLSRPGDQLIAHATSHLLRSEAGGPAVHAGLMVHAIDSPDGRFTADEVRAAFLPEDVHQSGTRIVSIENTHSNGGGTVWSPEAVRQVTGAARALGVATHLDGARILNAAVAAGVPAAAYGSCFDTVTLCLSKGLGCPFGALLAGSQETMRGARRIKQQFGGALRQAGFVAAAGLYALDHHVERLAEDHANARALALGLAAAGVPLACPRVESNVVLIDLGALGLDDATGIGLMAEQEVLVSQNARPGVVRAVTHLDVSDADVATAIAAIAVALRGARV